MIRDDRHLRILADAYACPVKGKIYKAGIRHK